MRVRRYGILLAVLLVSLLLLTVQTRGGADALQGSLATNANFERIDPKAGGTIAFRFRP